MIDTLRAELEPQVHPLDLDYVVDKASNIMSLNPDASLPEIIALTFEEWKSEPETVIFINEIINRDGTVTQLPGLSPEQEQEMREFILSLPEE